MTTDKSRPLPPTGQVPDRRLASAEPRVVGASSPAVDQLERAGSGAAPAVDLPSAGAHDTRRADTRPVVSPPPAPGPSAPIVVARTRSRRRLLRRPLVLITVLTVLGALVATLAALAYTATALKTYTSEALVIVLSDSGSSDVGPITGAWVEIADAPTVLSGAADVLEVDAALLEESLTVSQPDSTPLVSIRMSTTDPAASALWANGVANQLLAQAQRRPIDGYRLNQLTTAVPAPEADPDRTALILTAAALGGALAGGVLGRAIARRRALA